MFVNEAYFFRNGSCLVYDYHPHGTLVVSYLPQLSLSLNPSSMVIAVYC